jgi:hypothetical protein
MLLALTLAAAALAFLWPGGSAGEKWVDVGPVDYVRSAVEHEPLHVPQGAGRSFFVVRYPTPLPEEFYVTRIGRMTIDEVFPEIVLDGLRLGFAALSERSPHREGLTVPYCPSSRWFQEPVHASKYLTTGEVVGGPTGRGLFHHPLRVRNGRIEINVDQLHDGAPSGMRSVPVEPLGPDCV